MHLSYSLRLFLIEPANLSIFYKFRSWFSSILPQKVISPQTSGGRETPSKGVKLFLVFDIFGDIFGTFTLLFFGFFIFVIIIVIIGVSFACRAGSGVAAMARGFSIEAPSFVIPEHQRGQRRSDGTEMKTVRLPDRCPSCGAAISHEGIDWTGPIEAK